MKQVFFFFFTVCIPCPYLVGHDAKVGRRSFLSGLQARARVSSEKKKLIFKYI